MSTVVFLALCASALQLAFAGVTGEMLDGSAETFVAPKTHEIPLGHPDFYPSHDRPIGWRGDWTGAFPGANCVTIWNAETGEVLVRHVEGADIVNTYSDPIYSGKYLYHFEGNGLCKIRDPHDNFKVVGVNLLEPGLNAIPVFVGRRMYIRTDLSVYCIEEPSSDKRITE